MKTKVFLIRHGETEWNKLGKFQGSTDIPLSKEGIVQAQCVSERLNGNFDYIYSSPLKRAVKTAEIIAATKGIKPLIAKDMTEINFGQWEGLTRQEIEKNYPEEFIKWSRDKVEAPICGGDLSMLNASIRSKNNILQIVKAHRGKTIVIVAHGGIIKAGLIGIFNWDMTMYQKLFLGNTSINEITFDDLLNPVIVTLNDTTHLPGGTNTYQV